MSSTTLPVLERNVQKTREWVHEVSSELGTADERLAWRVLGAHMQTLRDRLTVDEGAQLAAQLPHMLRGVFYEGFDPSRTPERIRDADAFLDLLDERAQLGGRAEASRAAAAATRVLRRHVTPGEMDDALSQLPAEIREVLERPGG